MTIEFSTIKDKLETVDARVGTINVYKNDSFVSYAIKLYGEYCQAEIDIMKLFIEKDSLYIDVGVNIGYHSMAIYKETGCSVVGFEPHPMHFAVAAENCKNLPIQLFNAALSSYNKSILISEIDLDIVGNYGETKQESEGKITAQAITLDSLNVPKISGIKIDVEGFEYEVLKGGEKTIDKYRPVVLYEALDLDWTRCFDFFDHKGYKQYWIACYNTPLKDDTFIPKDPNFDPGFGQGGVTNIIAVPNEKPQLSNLMPVVQDESYEDCVKRLRSYVIAF